jgi:hypothetical protein
MRVRQKQQLLRLSPVWGAEVPALLISHVSVKDEEAFGKYAVLAGPAIEVVLLFRTGLRLS